MNLMSDLRRTKRAESVKKQAIEKLEEGPLLSRMSPRTQVPLKLLVDEIIKYLIEIIQALLQEQNSNNYLHFLASNQKMHKELERKMVNMIGEKCYEIRCEFIDRFDEVQKLSTTRAKKDYGHDLRKERKNITQNILAYHRSNSFNSYNHPKQHQLEKFGSFNEIPLPSEGQDKLQEIGSIQINSIQSKLSALEETQNLKMKESLARMEKKFEENCRDIKLLAQKHVEFKLKFEEKLELSLESIWNVISDNQSKICQMQRLFGQHSVS